MPGDKRKILLHADENRQSPTETSPLVMLSVLAISERNASTAAFAKTVIVMISYTTTVNIDMIVLMSVVFVVVLYVLTDTVVAATARHRGYRPDSQSNLSNKSNGGVHLRLLPIISGEGSAMSTWQ